MGKLSEERCSKGGEGSLRMRWEERGPKGLMCKKCVIYIYSYLEENKRDIRGITTKNGGSQRRVMEK